MDYPFKTTPFRHQLEEWTRNRDESARAILWEQGTGKSKLILDTAAWLWLQGRIDGVLIVAPNGVHRNWVEQEIPAHVPDTILEISRAFHYQAPRAPTKWHQRLVGAVIGHQGLAWLTISYDAMMTAAGRRAVNGMLDTRRVLYVLDESHNIKSPQAKRTKSILLTSGRAPFRRILTGTPIAQGPFDAYSQVKFLDPTYWDKWGLSTFTTFRANFGMFERIYNPHIRKSFNESTGRWEHCHGGYAKVLKEYRNLDQLQEMLAPISSRVTKDDVLDLPPKLYEKRYITMTTDQARLYKQMREEFVVWLDGGDPVVAELAITRLLRLQQITCGYVPTDEVHTIQGPNRRLDALCAIIEEAQHKVIVWARFQMDITLILEAMRERGIPAVRYDGQVDDDERAEAVARFQGERPTYQNGQVIGREPVPEGEQVKVFVGNPAAGATGLTLTEARTVVYYSNSYKLIDRLQSEDRAHRIGQSNSVLYVDLIAEDTIDEQIVEALRNKRDVADQITGDKLKSWL